MLVNFFTGLTVGLQVEFRLSLKYQPVSGPGLGAGDPRVEETLKELQPSKGGGIVLIIIAADMN